MSSDGDRPYSRRRLLRRIGAVAGASALAGCPATDGPDGGTTEGPGETPPPTDGGTAEPSRATPPVAEQFESVVNVVDEGMDPGGETPINGLLDEHVDDDTLFYFPEGEYRMDGTWERQEFRNLGFVGDGAVIRPPRGHDSALFLVGVNSDRAAGFLFSGFTFDLSAPDTGARPLHAAVQDGLQVRDVTVRGRQDVDHDSMRFDVTDPGGTGLVEGLRMPDGGVAEYEITGCYVGAESVGTLTFRECHVANFPDNGVYASQAEGPVHVLGGRYENNNVSNVRVGGDGVVRGVTVRSTEAREGFDNVRGIRLRRGEDLLVEDCDVEFADASGSDGAVVMGHDLGSATVRNTRIRVDVDGVPAVWAKDPEREDSGTDVGDGRVRLENVEVTGSAADRSTIVISKRHGCVLAGLCVSQSGAGRNGVKLIGSRDGAIRDAAIRVTGEPILLQQEATVTREDVALGDPSGPSGGDTCHTD